MSSPWYLRAFWPPLVVLGCIVLAAYWPHFGGSMAAGAPQRMVWLSLLALVASIPALSVVFPMGRAPYVLSVSIIVLAVSLGLAVLLNGGLHPLPWNAPHYRWVAVWATLAPTLAWVSICALARYLTQDRPLATRLLTVGALYLLALMVVSSFLAPLRELYFLTFTYATLLFTYFEGNGSGLFFPHQLYHLTLEISLGTSLIAWGFIAVRRWAWRRPDQNLQG